MKICAWVETNIKDPIKFECLIFHKYFCLKAVKDFLSKKFVVQGHDEAFDSVRK